MRFLFTLLFLFALLSNNQAQISQPCARTLTGLNQDSVTWSANPCPGFGGYVILGGLGNDPLLPLDTITDPNATFFVQANPGEQTRRYQIGQLCGGVLQDLSVVLSNQRPITPNIRNVSIDHGKPLITWYSSPSPGVIGYQLYKENPYGSGNYFPYPASNQLISDTFFLDQTSTDLLVRYALVAVTPCNKSLLGEGTALDGTTGPHTSILVQGSLDACQRSIKLSWNSYENWALGVQRYEIVGRQNFGPEQILDTLAPNQTRYTFQNVENGQQWSIAVRAVEQGNPQNKATTNTLQFQVIANRPIDFLFLEATTLQTNGQTYLAWDWDMDSDFQTALVQQSSDGQTFNDLISINDLNQTNFLVNPSQAGQYYRIRAQDNCGNWVQSNTSQTLSLQGQALDRFINNLTWAAPNWTQAQVEEYEIYRIVGSDTQRLQNLDANTLRYEEQVNIRNVAEANVCYFVRAWLSLELPNTGRRWVQTQSNILCLDQDPTVQLPNAFAPDGQNRWFKPVVTFGRNLSQYSLRIYNRYGQLMFETNQWHQGWDGNYQGQPLPAGSYVYQLSCTLPDGEQIFKQGNVQLLR